MITNVELTQMKERADKATHGPWTSTKSGENTFAIDSETITSAFYLAFVENDCNASFIAHAREDVPRLVAEVERLRRALETAGAYGHFGWSWHEHREIVNALNVEDEWFEKNCSQLIDAEFYEVESDGDDD